MFVHFADDSDMAHGLVDRTMVRAHPCAAGAQKNGTQDEQALGGRRGGCSTKRQLLVAGLDNPFRIHLTGGHCHASPHAPALMAGLTCERVIADRGYAGHACSDLVISRGAAAVIPPHPRAKEPRAYDRWW